MNLQPVRTGETIEIDGNELSEFEASELYINLVRCLTQNPPIQNNEEKETNGPN